MTKQGTLEAKMYLNFERMTALIRRGSLEAKLAIVIDSAAVRLSHHGSNDQHFREDGRAKISNFLTHIDSVEKNPIDFNEPNIPLSCLNKLNQH